MHKMLDAVGTRGAAAGKRKAEDAEGEGGPAPKRGRPAAAPKKKASGRTKRKRTSGKAGKEKTDAPAAPKCKKGSGKPTWSNEKTRSQIQCRNPNWAIKYGPGQAFTFQQAEDKANKWLKSALKEWRGKS